MMLYGSAVLATVRRDAKIFLSYRLRFVSQLLAMLLTLTMFYYISKLVRVDAVGVSGHYYAFAVLGVVTTSVLAAALGASQVVRIELMQGNFERMVVSPLGPVGGVLSVTVFPIAYASFIASVAVAASIALFGVPLHVAGIPLAVAIGVLGVFSFVSIGLLLVAGLLVFKSAMGASWIITGVGLLGGAYFPVRILPEWLRWASAVQPFTPTVDLLRHSLVGTPALHPVWLELLKLGAFTAVLVPAALLVLSVAVRMSRRHGTLMEY